MKLWLSLKSYQEALKDQENTPVELSRILKPFGLIGLGSDSPDLLVGHLLDALAEEFRPEQLLTGLDVAEVLADMGYASAEGFLPSAQIMYQAQLTFLQSREM